MLLGDRPRACRGRSEYERPRSRSQAWRVNFQVTALSLYGGIRLPFAIGAVVDGEPTTFQTPLSGQTSPVLAVVPIGTRVLLVISVPSGRRYGGTGSRMLRPSEASAFRSMGRAQGWRISGKGNPTLRPVIVFCSFLARGRFRTLVTSRVRRATGRRHAGTGHVIRRPRDTSNLSLSGRVRRRTSATDMPGWPTNCAPDPSWGPSILADPD